jgi:transposase
MIKENKLINKVKRLIRRAGLPRWFHRFGPKKYEFWQHALALIIKQECRLGYRRVSNLLRMLGFNVPSYSALAKMFKRIDWRIWQLLLKMTNNRKLGIVAIDGSGMSRPLPSPYYCRHIDKPYPIEIPLKLSLAVETRTKKIVSLRLRAKSRHDLMDAKYLIKRLPSYPKKIVADKGYDAEWLHRYCHSLGIKAIIPMRDYGSKPIYRGKSLRRICRKTFNKRVYHRREVVESVFSAIKRKFGASVSSVQAHTRRAEIYCRAISHNIIFILIKHFQRSQINRNIYIYSSRI